jgi:hypothetical protein
METQGIVLLVTLIAGQATDYTKDKKTPSVLRPISGRNSNENAKQSETDMCVFLLPPWPSA